MNPVVDDPDLAGAAIPRRTACATDWSTAPMGWQGSGSAAHRLVGLLFCSLLLALSACSREPEEQRLRAAIAAMQEAAEARRPAAVVEWVSEDFSGSHDLDRERLRRLVQAQMLGNREVGVTLGPLEVELDGAHATVRFLALTTGGSGRVLPDRVRGYRVVSHWRLEDGQWRVHRAEWAAERSAD
jgi:hypothetical protein